MPNDTAQRLTLMFVDIPTAVELRESVGDAVARDFLKHCTELISGLVEARTGVVVRAVGSTLLCSFVAVDNAVLAACEIQHAVRGFPADGLGATPAVRVGLHTGDVVIQNDSCTGDVVTTAARVITVAKPAQVIATRAVVDASSQATATLCSPLTEPPDAEARVGTALSLVAWERWRSGAPSEAAARITRSTPRLTLVPPGGKPRLRLDTAQRVRKPDDDVLDLTPQPQELENPRAEAAMPPAAAAEGTGAIRKLVLPKAAAREAQPRPTTPPGGVRPPLPGTFSPQRLCVIWNRRAIIIDAHRPVVSMGRDEANDIVVNVGTASRRHAEIEMRNDGFYLVDHSGNGTFYYDEKGREHILAQNEIKLGTDGVICPGCPGDVEGAQAVRFIRAT